MKALEAICSRAAAENLPFLLAGGHAVIVHGHPRATFDIDLIISRDDRTAWSRLAGAFGYILLREGPTFLQFDPGSPGFPPLDLMLVSPATFAQMMAAAVSGRSPAPNVRMVSLLHLLALKCHAIKHGHSGRSVKDADDVIRLVQANRLDLNVPAIRQLFLKYGTPELYEKVRRLCTQD